MVCVCGGGGEGEGGWSSHFCLVTCPILFSVPSVPFIRSSRALVSQMWLMNLDCRLNTVSFIPKYTRLKFSRVCSPLLELISIGLRVSNAHAGMHYMYTHTCKHFWKHTGLQFHKITGFFPRYSGMGRVGDHLEYHIKEQLGMEGHYTERVWGEHWCKYLLAL